MEAGVHQYYQGQPVVTLGLDTYNGSAAAVEVFRSVTGVTFPLLTQGGTYGTQNNGNFRKVVIDPDGIVRYVSGQYVLNITAIRTAVDQWLPLDDPTFTFTMQDTLETYTDGFATYGFYGTVVNLLDQDRQLVLTLTPVDVPDPLRMYSICTYHGCFPPDSGTVVINEFYSALQDDDSLIFDIYNLAINEQTGFADTSTIQGDYVLQITIHNPDDPQEIIGYNLYLDEGSSVRPRIEPIPTSSALLRNYPNPFNPETTIQFVVNNPGAVELNVFNVLGQNVASLVNTPFMASGTYSAHWKAVNAQGLPLPSGNYFVELNNAGLRAVHKVLLVR
ncbi:MAG: T9SS type A sorting domain-containing protein [Calditrichaeota bacterium]|nr:T9SS type A sorting domain-containing protein [Calditrichota bacterium]